MTTETAISLHFKYTAGDDFVRDGRTHAQLPIKDLSTKIQIYEDRVDGWFLQHARKLLGDGNADYVVLQIALAQVEGMQQFREGKSSEKGSRPCFVRALRRLFSLKKNTKADLEAFYGAVRCGLFHDGFTKGVVFVSRTFTEPMTIQKGYIFVNAEKFLGHVVEDLKNYVSALRAGIDRSLIGNFDAMWTAHWRSAKGPLSSGSPPWPIAPTPARVPVALEA
jgi:hypothetical protein